MDHFQVRKGPYSTRFKGLYTSCMQIAICRYSVDCFEQGGVSSGTGAIALPFDEEQNWFCGGLLKSGEVPGLLKDEEFEMLTQGKTTFLSLAVDMNLLDRMAQACTGLKFSRLLMQKRLHFHPMDLAHVRTRLTALFTNLHRQTVLNLNLYQQQQLEMEILETLFTKVQVKSQNIKMSDRLKAAHLAKDYILNNLRSDLNISRLSQVTDCSRETLHKGFKERYGISPSQYIRTIRLNRVREELQNSTQSGIITETAMKWGFFHLGRFSGYYYQLFGESPRQTVQKVHPVQSYPCSKA
jgi:AraC-like DNA-binding protein